MFVVNCSSFSCEALSVQSHTDTLAICRPSGYTMVSGIVVVGVCKCCQMRASKWACLIFGVSIGLDPG